MTPEVWTKLFELLTGAGLLLFAYGVARLWFGPSQVIIHTVQCDCKDKPQNSEEEN